MGRAMGMFNEILSSPNMMNMLGPQAVIIPSNIKIEEIEEVHEIPALTEKEQDILDEINTLTAADSPIISSEKTELEQTLEEAGHL